MRRISSFVILSTLACGAPSEHIYTADCLTFESSIELNQESLDNNVSVAKGAMSSIVPDFCNAFSGVRIVVMPHARWMCSFGAECSGEYAAIENTAYLNRSTRSLVHELFHAWDSQHLVLNTEHINWDTNGYNAADLEYKTLGISAHIIDGL